MDYETASAVMTVVMFVVFIAIVLWAYSRRQRSRFEEAAQLPLDDELAPARAKEEAAK